MPASRRSGDDWPAYLPGPRDDIMAVGVISLTYGLLENMFRALFSVIADMNEHQIAAIFDRLPSNARIDAIKQLLPKTTLHEILKDRVLHFCEGYDICTDNRNAIMHSHSGGIFTSFSRSERGFLLSKYSRSGNKLVCAASLLDLRRVADENHAFALFGMYVTGDVRIFRASQEHGDQDVIGRLPLRDKPPLPIELSWTPEAALIGSPPHQSSQK
jgi:hypothetical protein